MENNKHNIEKQKLREKIWRKMDSSGITIFPYAYGRIPNFTGSDIAGNKVTILEEWKKAKIVFSNPDFAQQKVRENALRADKILIMASPKLKHGFIRVDPSITKGKERFASTISGAFIYGKIIEELIKPDLIITGCVAVDEENFIRLGKGGGYGDREIKMIEEKFGKVPVITTVHDVQVVKNIPFDENDARVDIIVTPTRIIRRKV